MLKDKIQDINIFNNKCKNIKTTDISNKSYITHYDKKNVTEAKKNIPIIHTEEIIYLNDIIDNDKSFIEVLNNRKSSRDFTDDDEISIEELSTILSLSNGNKTQNSGKYVPSSGGFNSVNIYVIILKSNNLKKGIYLFDSNEDCLKLIDNIDCKNYLINDVIFQKEFTDSPILIAMTTDFGRLSKKYSNRAYRLAGMDIGHVSMMLYLTCSYLNIKSCSYAAFNDDEINSLLRIKDTNSTSTFLMFSLSK